MFRNVRVEFADDADGTIIAKVPLAGGKGFVVLNAEDYRDITNRGYSSRWSYSRTNTHKTKSYSYVYMGTPGGGSFVVARLILGAAARQVVNYLDGDHTNLRRSNLATTEGWAKRRPPEFAKVSGDVEVSPDAVSGRLGGHGGAEMSA